MPSTHTCLRCQRLLDVSTLSGLCAACQALVDQPSDITTQAVSSGPRTPPHPNALRLDATPDIATADFDPLSANTRPLDFVPRTVVPLPRVPEGYQPLEVLGHGGMGLVVKCLEISAERIVALKLMTAGAASQARDRFHIEVRAVARLRHDNIVQVLSLGLDHPDPYFTMEYAAGGTLQTRLRADGPLPVAEAVRVMTVAARAIHDIHTANVLHRDLKPSNILLAKDGTPKLADFGLAKRLDREDGLTITEHLLGTPEYMAPEQAGRRNDELDFRTDVYGLGATLYAVLTGVPPFRGRDMADTLRMVSTERPVPLRNHRPNVPAEVEAIVLKCLEKNPSHRYQSAAELADDLDRWAAGQATNARPVTWIRRVAWAIETTRGRVVAAALTVAVVAFAVALIGWGRWTPPADTGRDVVPRPRRVLATLPAEPFQVPNFPPELTHQQARDQLQAGKAVVLVGPNGPRVPLAWGRGMGDIPAAPTPEARFSVLTPLNTVLHLLPDPGIDQYRIRAVLRQEKKRTLSRQKGVSAFSYVGIVVGHARAIAGEEAIVHAMVSASFSEPGGPRTGVLGVLPGYALERPLDNLFHADTFLREVPLLAEAEEHPWRAIEIEARPTGLTIRCGKQSVTCPEADIHRIWQTSDNNSRFSARHNVVEGDLPTWTPRLPIGVFVQESWVTVRDMTIEPIDF